MDNDARSIIVCAVSSLLSSLSLYPTSKAVINGSSPQKDVTGGNLIKKIEEPNNKRREREREREREGEKEEKKEISNSTSMKNILSLDAYRETRNVFFFLSTRIDRYSPWYPQPQRTTFTRIRSTHKSYLHELDGFIGNTSFQYFS